MHYSARLCRLFYHFFCLHKINWNFTIYNLNSTQRKLVTSFICQNPGWLSKKVIVVDWSFTCKRREFTHGQSEEHVSKNRIHCVHIGIGFDSKIKNRNENKIVCWLRGDCVHCHRCEFCRRPRRNRRRWARRTNQIKWFPHRVILWVQGNWYY